MRKELVTGILTDISDNAVTIDGRNFSVKEKKIANALSSSVGDTVSVVVEHTEDDAYVVDIKSG
jgi:PDZ domain-containing secreted protein